MTTSTHPDQPPARYPDAVDVVVVGSGPAGATYARVLSEQAPALRVAVLEVGPTLGEVPGAHVKNIADPGERARAQRRSEGPAPRTADAPTDTMDGYADEGTADAPARLQRPGTFLLPDGWQQPGEDGMPAAAMSSNVGGMAAHWTGACPRPGQSERIAFLPGLDDLLAEAERLLHVDAAALAGAPLADVVRARLAAALDPGRPADRTVRPMPLAVRREADGRLHWSGADVVFGEETRQNPQVTLHDETLVRRVLVEDGRATGVEVQDLRVPGDAAPQVIRASRVVVAADALRTPQLLFASGVRPPALGRWLNDQPQVVFAVALDDVPDTGSSDTRDTGITAQSGVSWVPFTDEHPFHGQVMQLDASPVPVEGTFLPGSVVGLGWFCAKDLQASDRVEFDEEAVDAYGMPAPRIHYTLTDRDHATIARARREIVEVARALGRALDAEPLTFPPGASLHYQGTVRMGPADDGRSVCGPDGQVWGVAGLHVAGNGVIPTATACNPTLTAVALAVAGARSIVAACAPARTGAPTGA